MRILILGGTRYFGVHLVNSLLRKGYEITVATRGNVKREFCGNVEYKTANRLNPSELAKLFENNRFDIVYDNLAYCSNDVRNLLENDGCGRYIMTSSGSVYDLQLNTFESDFDPGKHVLKWCGRDDFPYDEIKRQAECALFQHYPNIESVAVRLPYVLGKDDYTQRLFFYVNHIKERIPMNIDNMDSEMGFIDSKEAGEFLSSLAERPLKGTVNASSKGTVSLRKIIEYVEKALNTKALYSPEGDIAPYNGSPAYSLNTSKAERYGFEFTNVDDWIYDLLDWYIAKPKG